MNGPIQALYTSGNILYAVLINSSDGTIWNQTNQNFEVYNSGHWSQYAVPLTEYAGSGYYRAAYPIASPTNLTMDIIYAQSGGSPTLGDPPASNLYQSQGENIASAGNIWQAGQNMAAALSTQQIGAISGTPSNNKIFVTNLTSTQLDTYAGRVMIMTSGTLIQQASTILAYNGGTFTITITGFPSGGTPADGDTFVII